MTSGTPHQVVDLPGYGALGSASTRVTVPAGSVETRLVRITGADVAYDTPPQVPGFVKWRWERDTLAGTGRFAVTAPHAELAALRPLGEWSATVRPEAPGGVLAGRNSAASRAVAGLARSLLSAAESLHAAGWRLGPLTPDTAYAGPDFTLFLPDLGFAWLGAVELGKPNWLKPGPDDATLWGEDRKRRQFASPAQSRKYHPEGVAEGPELPAALVKRDVALVGRLLRALLTGTPGGEPAGGGRDKLWAAIRDAEAGKFASAAAMKDAVLAALKAPVEVTEVERPPKPSRKLPAAVGVLGLAAAVAVAGWYALGDSLPPRPNGKPETPTTVPAVTAPDGVEPLVEAIAKAPTLADKARAAVKLQAVEPKHATVARVRVEVVAEIRRLWPLRDDQVLGLKSQELLDVLKQLP